MRKLLVSLALGCVALLSACNSKPAREVQHSFYRIHEGVFGCPPKDYPKCWTPPPEERSLNAEEPKTCNPVYKRPDCGCPKEDEVPAPQPERKLNAEEPRKDCSGSASDDFSDCPNGKCPVK